MCRILVYTASRIPCLNSEDLKLETVLSVDATLRCHAGLFETLFNMIKFHQGYFRLKKNVTYRLLQQTILP